MASPPPPSCLSTLSDSHPPYPQDIDKKMFFFIPLPKGSIKDQHLLPVLTYDLVVLKKMDVIQQRTDKNYFFCTNIAIFTIFLQLPRKRFFTANFRDFHTFLGIRYIYASSIKISPWNCNGLRVIVAMLFNHLYIYTD